MSRPLDSAQDRDDSAMIQNPIADQFRAIAIGDKTLTGNGIAYVLFYDIDQEDFSPPRSLPADWRLFKTVNGYHIVGIGLYSAWVKEMWWRQWQFNVPSDYRLENINWLAPQSPEEAQFILEQFGPYAHKECTYYRDKAVFEKWESDRP